jgi:hypothetical protein
MNSIKWIPLVAMIVLACSEHKSNLIIPQEDYSDLFQSWTHSFEEQTDSVQIFRPTNSRQFPISRFRQILEFHSDSTCNYLAVGTNDYTYMVAARWSIISHNDRILAIFDTTGELAFRFKVVELQQDLLRLVFLY